MVHLDICQVFIYFVQQSVSSCVYFVITEFNVADIKVDGVSGVVDFLMCLIQSSEVKPGIIQQLCADDCRDSLSNSASKRFTF